VQSEVNAGRQKGVQRTPTLFVNGEPLVGVPAFDQLRALVEQKLGAAGPRG
jgi:protein-disulfide isomerase